MQTLHSTPGAAIIIHIIAAPHCCTYFQAILKPMLLFFFTIECSNHCIQGFVKFVETVEGPIHMFSVHDPGKMFSKQVLGTQVFRLRALWNVLGIPSFRFKLGTRLGLRGMLCLHCATCEVILTCTLHADSGLRAKPRSVRTCSRFHIVQTAFRRRTKGDDLFWEHGFTVFQVELF